MQASALARNVPLRALLLPLLCFLCSACSSVPKSLVNTVDRADGMYKAGNYEGALQAYREASKEASRLEYRADKVQVRIGQCLLALERPEEARKQFESIEKRVKDNELVLGSHIRFQECLAHAEACCELARREEPFGADTGDPLAMAQRREAVKVAIEDYKEARRRYEIALSIDGGGPPYEALLGKGYTFLKEGILGVNDNFLREAEKIFQDCAAAGQKDPRLHYYLGRLQEALHSGGRLTPASLGEYVTSLNLAGENGTLYREPYRHFLAILRAKGLTVPPDLEKQPEAMRSQLKILIDRLERYPLAEESSGEPRGSWSVFERDLRSFISGYQGWITARENADRLVREADHQLRRGDYLESYQSALAKLEKVDDRFRGEEKYQQLRKEVQTSLVHALRDTAAQLTKIGAWEQATAHLQRAIDLCDPDYVDKYAELRRDCKSDKRQAESLQKFAMLEKNVRDLLGKKDEDKARERLADARKDPSLTQVPDDRWSGLQKEVDKAAAVEQIYDLIADAESGSSKSDAVLEKGLHALQLARTENLPEWKAKAARVVAKAQFALQNYNDSMAALDEIERPGPNDTILRALCLYQKQDYASAAKSFGQVNPQVLATAEYRVAGLKAAGLSFLMSGNADRARWYLEKADGSDPEVSRALLRTYQQRLDELSGKSDYASEVELREKVLGLDPTNADNLRRLALAYQESAAETGDIQAYKKAYTKLQHYFQLEDAPPLNDKQKQVYSALVACFADYVPLRQGMFWEYRVGTTGGGTESNVIRYEVTGGGGNRFQVSCKGADPEKQEWVRLEENRELERRDPDGRPFAVFPVGLQRPDQKPLPSCHFTVGPNHYKAELLAFGRQVIAAGHTYENCIEVRLSTADARGSEDYWFAPEVGLVKYENSATGEVWELISSAALGGPS